MTRILRLNMPTIEPSWDRGPAISAPADELRAWLDAQKRDDEPRLIRVLVTLVRGDYGFDLSRARIGALEIQLTDYALGVGLAGRTHNCTDDVCSFLAQAFWRDGVLELRQATMQPLAPDELAAVTHLAVEGESAN